MLNLSKRLSKVENLVPFAGRNAGVDSALFGIYDKDENLVGTKRIRSLNSFDDDGEPDITIPEKMAGFLDHYPLKVCFGGRGSAKTRSIVSILVERCRIRFERIVCCREIQKSIETSSYQEIVDEIGRRGLDDEFAITDKKITHKSTGSTFGFLGLYRNQTQIKGYAGATIAWVEEAENVSRKSWDFLVNTIRAPLSEIWISFNPAQRDDPTWVDFVEPYVSQMESGIYQDEDALVVKINWSDNPWFKYSSLPEKREKLMIRDYQRYLWIYEGEFFNRTESQVFADKWEVMEFEAPEDMIEFYHGMDFGFAKDPSAVTRCFVMNDCLYIDYEAGGVGVPLDDHGKLIDKIPTGSKYDILCDCARPETINHLQRKGYKTKSASKWSGSVEDGVEFIRSFARIYIHPRCQETAKEFAKYSYKVSSKTDEVLPVIDDAWNHYIDSIRYALSPLIKDKGEWFFG